MDYCNIAMEYALDIGADYADIRIQKTTAENFYLRNLSMKSNNFDVKEGFSVRVLKDGAWGMYHCNIFSESTIKDTVEKAFEIAKLSSRINRENKIKLCKMGPNVDTYGTEYQIDPFNIPLSEKIDIMMEVNQTLMNHKGIVAAHFMMRNSQEEKIFASTEGSFLNLRNSYVYPQFTAVAVNNIDSQTRSFDQGALVGGFERIKEINLISQADRVAKEALMKVNADVLSEEKRRTLILNPGHLALTMHESVGHATELDRVLGWEADMAGRSFATPDLLNKFKYGSKIVNFVADNRLKNGIATHGYDDDGVIGQRWHIIKNGILKEYGTTRDTASTINAGYSRGCNRATYYYDFPINRIPNLYLEPGKNKLSLQDLIADTEDGIYIEDRGSFSIDQHRVNFQFGGDLFWEIKNGKKTRMLKKVIYRSHNPEFWNSCDAICDKNYWKSYSFITCGKGQPMQSGRMTHGASPARFRNITVGGSK